MASLEKNGIRRFKGSEITATGKAAEVVEWKPGLESRGQSLQCSQEIVDGSLLHLGYRSIMGSEHGLVQPGDFRGLVDPAQFGQAIGPQRADD